MQWAGGRSGGTRSAHPRTACRPDAKPACPAVQLACRNMLAPCLCHQGAKLTGVCPRLPAGDARQVSDVRHRPGHAHRVAGQREVHCPAPGKKMSRSVKSCNAERGAQPAGREIACLAGCRCQNAPGYFAPSGQRPVSGTRCASPCRPGPKPPPPFSYLEWPPPNSASSHRRAASGSAPSPCCATKAGFAARLEEMASMTRCRVALPMPPPARAQREAAHAHIAGSVPECLAVAGE